MEIKIKKVFELVIDYSLPIEVLITEKAFFEHNRWVKEGAQDVLHQTIDHFKSSLIMNKTTPEVHIVNFDSYRVLNDIDIDIQAQGYRWCNLVEIFALKKQKSIELEEFLIICGEPYIINDHIDVRIDIEGNYYYNRYAPTIVNREVEMKCVSGIESNKKFLESAYVLMPYHHFALVKI